MRKKGEIWVDLDKEDFGEDIYSEDTRELLVDNDEMTPEEAGFMQGYDEAG